MLRGTRLHRRAEAGQAKGQRRGAGEPAVAVEEREDDEEGGRGRRRPVYAGLLQPADVSLFCPAGARCVRAEGQEPEDCFAVGRVREDVLVDTCRRVVHGDDQRFGHPVLQVS